MGGDKRVVTINGPSLRSVKGCSKFEELYTLKPACRQAGNLPVAKRSSKPVEKNITRLYHQEIASSDNIWSNIIHPVASSQ